MAEVLAARRRGLRRRRKPATTYVFRAVTIGYLFLLVAWPVGLVAKNTFADGFVIQYTLNGTMETGHRGALWICIVARVRDGRITRIDEYMDTSKFATWMGAR